VRTHPTPKSCPRCGGRKIAELDVTPTGVFPWQCRTCRAIGYDDRVVGDPVRPGAPRVEGARKVDEQADAIRRARRAAQLEREGRTR
jgi:hypothetical protein